MVVTDRVSPSGKAVGSGPTIRGFESLHPSQKNEIESLLSNFIFLRVDRDYLSLHPSQNQNNKNGALWAPQVVGTL